MSGDRGARLEALKKLASPFRHTSAPPAWAERSGHVASLNALALDAVSSLIDTARGAGSRAQCGLVVGEPGSGKTHLLGAVHHELALYGDLCTLVAVSPPTDVTRPLRHLAAQVVCALGHRTKRTTRPSSLARLLARAVAAWLQDEEGKSAREAVARKELKVSQKWEDISGQVSEWLQDQHPELWPPLLEALIQYPIPTKQARALQWMRGDPLSSSEIAELGMTAEAPRSEADHEASAGWKISSLARLLSLERPLMLVFDEIDGPPWADRRGALSTMIGHLLEHTQHTVVVACASHDGWEKLVDMLEPPVAERLGSHRIELTGCSRPVIDGLVAARLATLPADLTAGGFPFDDPLSRHQLADLALGGRPPARDVLRKARQMWAREVGLESAAADPAKALFDEWLSARQTLIAADLDLFAPEEGVLLDALTLALENAGRDSELVCEAQFRNTGKGAEPALNARLRMRAGTYRFRFLTSLKREQAALAEPVFAALRLVHEGQLDIPIVVRDFRCPLPDFTGWPGRSPIDALLEAGGYLIQLDKSQMALCWALRQLGWAVTAGELEELTADGDLQPLGTEKLKAYLAGRELFPKLLASLTACAARLRDRRPKPV
jgi:hypothetical protein